MASRGSAANKKAFRLAAVLMLFFFVCTFIFPAEPVFADTKADPDITIVTPAADTPVQAPNLLLSVKVAKKAKITVELFKEETVTTTVVVTNTKTAKSGAGSKVVATSPTKTEKVVTQKTYTSVMDKEEFTSDTDLSFYTKKIEGVAVGTYKLSVTTLDADGKATFLTERMITVEEKAKDESAIFDKSESGTLTFLKSLLTTIFGN